MACQHRSRIIQLESKCLVMLQIRHAYLAVQVCTILSQNTTDVNSARAFAKLKEKFPDWEMVRTANTGASLFLLRMGKVLVGPF